MNLSVKVKALLATICPASMSDDTMVGAVVMPGFTSFAMQYDARLAISAGPPLASETRLSTVEISSACALPATRPTAAAITAIHFIITASQQGGDATTTGKDARNGRSCRPWDALRDAGRREGGARARQPDPEGRAGRARDGRTGRRQQASQRRDGPDVGLHRAGGSRAGRNPAGAAAVHHRPGRG